MHEGGSVLLACVHRFQVQMQMLNTILLMTAPCQSPPYELFL